MSNGVHILDVRDDTLRDTLMEEPLDRSKGPLTSYHRENMAVLNPKIPPNPDLIRSRSLSWIDVHLD